MFCPKKSSNVMSEMGSVVISGVFTDAVSGLLAALIATTGLTAAVSRYATVLADKTEHEVERATAVGFWGPACSLS